MLGVDLIRGSRHGAFLSSFAGANQTGSNGLDAVLAPISAHFFVGTRGVLAPITIKVRAVFVLQLPKFGVRAADMEQFHCSM